MNKKNIKKEEKKRIASSGVRTHAILQSEDLKSSALTTRPLTRIILYVMSLSFNLILEMKKKHILTNYKSLN